MKPTGKILQADYDLCISADDAGKVCQVCLTRGEINALLAIIEPLSWSTRWYHATGGVDEDKINAFYSDIVWRLMEMCCSDDNQTLLNQIDPVTGTVYSSTDGGTTYFPNPDDPRNSGVALPPPVTSGVSADKCAAASSALGNFIEYVQTIVDQKTSTATKVEFLLAIAAFLVATLVGVGWALLPLILEPIMNLVFSYNLIDFSAAMTVPGYQALICILFCEIEEDGSFTQTGFNNCLAKTATLPNAILQQTARSWLRGLTLLGLNNAAATGKGSAYTCDDCDCECNITSWGVWNGIGTGLTTGSDADGDYIQVNSVLNTEILGGHGVIVTTNNPGLCCSFESTIGSTPSTGGTFIYAACGEAIPLYGSAFPHSGLAPAIPVNTMGHNSTTPFTVKWYFS